MFGFRTWGLGLRELGFRVLIGTQTDWRSGSEGFKVKDRLSRLMASWTWTL